MYLYVKMNRDANCFLSDESKDCINSVSYEQRNMSARIGAQLVTIGLRIPTICWNMKREFYLDVKTFPAKTTKTRAS